MGAPVVARKQRKGIAVILTTLSMFVMVPIVGLGIDVSTLYIIRAKLFEAVDAGALAGARALAKGSNSGTQISNAQATATKFFNANFPAGFWGVTGITLDPPVIDDTSVPNYRTISVSSRAGAALLSADSGPGHQPDRRVQPGRP
jgi:Flp pilus assembly protein TadG